MFISPAYVKVQVDKILDAETDPEKAHSLEDNLLWAVALQHTNDAVRDELKRLENTKRIRWMA